MRKLYQLPGCPYALRTRIVLEHKALPYDLVNIDRANKPKEVLDASPGGTTPVLYDGHVKLRESSIINEYLDEQYPELPVMPRVPAARADVRLLIDALNPLLQASGQLVAATLKAESRDPEKVEAAKKAVLEALKPWEARVTVRGYLFGGALSLADVNLFAQLYSIQSLLEEPLPESLPHLRRWYAEMKAVPGITRALQRT